MTLGEAHAVLKVLAARGIEVRQELADQIRRCRDLDTLDRWLARAVVVASAEELFE